MLRAAGLEGAVVYLGTRLDFSQMSDGMPAAAVTFRLRDGAWALDEVARTTSGWDYAAEWAAGSRAPAIGPESGLYLEPHADLETRQVRFASNTLAATMPWPEPGQPPRAEAPDAGDP